MLVGIVGLNGSGKDSVAKIFEKSFNFEHKDLGEEIRKELKKLGKNPLDRDEMFALANERRKKFGNEYWVKRALEGHAKNKNLVITSIRNPAEGRHILSEGGIIVEVFADQKTRFARIKERSKSGKHGEKTFREFREKEERELSSSDSSKQQLLRCIKMAFVRIDNNGSLGDLEKTTSNFVKKIIQ